MTYNVLMGTLNSRTHSRDHINVICSRHRSGAAPAMCHWQ